MGNRSSTRTAKPAEAASGGGGGSKARRYKDTQWRVDAVERMVSGGELAPLTRGLESEMELGPGGDSITQEECPICFLFFPAGLNRTKCCNTLVCSDCFLTSKMDECEFCQQRKQGVKFDPGTVVTRSMEMIRDARRAELAARRQNKDKANQPAPGVVTVSRSERAESEQAAIDQATPPLRGMAGPGTSPLFPPAMSIPGRQGVN